MASNVTILYFIIKRSEFTRKDIVFLSRYYSLNIFEFNPLKKTYTPLVLIRQAIFILRHIFNTDIIFVEFAGYHSFLPLLFGKIFKIPSLIMVGGTECYNMPAINYGNFRKPVMSFFTKWSFSLATHCCPVHRSLIKSDYSYSDDIPKKQGYLNLYPNACSDYTEICNGYEAERFYFSEKEIRIKNSFITVASDTSGSIYYRKGIDMFLEAAKLFPDYKFTIIGTGPNLSKNKVPANVELYPYVKNDFLRDLYIKHEFYVQLSMAEGHPNAMSEAMLCGCIVIGSSVAGIPDIVDSSGFILTKKDIILLQKLVETAVNCNKAELSKLSRERIETIYPIQRREKEYIKVIADLLKGNFSRSDD